MTTTLSAQLRAAQNVFTHHVTVLTREFCGNASDLDKQHLITPFNNSMSNVVPLNYNGPSSTLSKLLSRLEEVEVPALLISDMHCNCSALTRKDFKSPPYSEPAPAPGWSSPKSAIQTAPSDWAWKSINGEKPGWHHRPSCPHESTVDPLEIRIVEQKDVKTATKNVRDIIVGLCLDCIRGSQPCRCLHPKPWEKNRGYYQGPWDPHLDVDCFSMLVPRESIDTEGMWVDPNWSELRTYVAPAWWEDAW